MNRHNKPGDDDDQALSEEFRVLREMEPPPGLREECLAAANEAAPSCRNPGQLSGPKNYWAHGAFGCDRDHLLVLPRRRSIGPARL